MTFLKTMGSRLAALRKNNNLTQEEAAKALKISRSTLASYEKDYRSPDYDTLVAISDFYKVSCDYLICGAESENYEYGDSFYFSEKSYNFLYMLSMFKYKNLRTNLKIKDNEPGVAYIEDLNTYKKGYYLEIINNFIEKTAESDLLEKIFDYIKPLDHPLYHFAYSQDQTIRETQKDTIEKLEELGALPSDEERSFLLLHNIIEDIKKILCDMREGR